MDEAYELESCKSRKFCYEQESAMRKIVSFALFVVLALSAIGFSRTPVALAATAPASLADLMPANVALYMDVRTANLDQTINTFVDLFRKAGMTVPTDLYAQIDQALTQGLGHPATFKGDVLSWLGDHLAIGGVITDQMLKDSTTLDATTLNQGLVIVDVKDEAAADKFLANVFAVIQKQGLTFNKTTDTINGSSASIYTSILSVDVVRFKGYLVIGNAPVVKDMIATLKAKKPTLGADAKFQKTLALLKPDNGLTAYISGRALEYQTNVTQTSLVRTRANISDNLLNTTATPTPEATLKPTPVPTASAQSKLMQQAYRAINGIAFAARQDGKVLALDIATSTDAVAMQALIKAEGLPASTLKPRTNLTGKLAAQIPSTAGAVIYGADLASIYTGLRAAFTSVNKLQMAQTPGLNLNQAEQGFQNFEDSIKSTFDLDINADVLSWMGGEYALYMNYDKTGDLAVASNNAFPYDSVLLIQATNGAKAKSFVEQINTTFKTQAGLDITTMGAPDLFSISGGQSPVRIGYGTAGDTFILSTGSGIKPAADAVNAGQSGDTLAAGKNPIWTHAIAALPSTYQSFLYFDLVQGAQYLDTTIKTQGTMAGSDPQTKQALAFLNEFESAVIYSNLTTDATSGSVTFALLLK